VSGVAREALARQFGAAIDMLENAIHACPDPLWSAGPPWQQFWYLASHTLFWLDYYLADAPEAFRPRAPFGLEEMDPAGVLPPRAFTRAELLGYLAHARARCRAVMAALDDESAARPCGFPRRDGSVFELHLYNLRHVQHHAAQLQLLLRQGGAEPPRWVSRSDRVWPGA
jgi:hypothetical protein